MTALLAATKRSLRRRDTTDTLRRLAREGHATGSFDADEGLRAVRRASRALGANCLSQSVALAAACRRAGLNPEVILGCRRYGDGKWGAHAWIVLDARVYDPLPSGEHQALASISAGTNWVPAPIVRGEN